MRRCTKCGRELPESEFYVRRDTDGLQSWCIRCCRNHGRLRNGSTGIYRKEEPLKLNIMENNGTLFPDDDNFVYLTFGERDSGRKRLGENRLSITRKKGSYYMTLNNRISKELISDGAVNMTVREDRLTGDVCLIFSREAGGVRASCSGKDKSNVVVWGKQFIEYFARRAGMDEATEYEVFQMSENLSAIPGTFVFRISFE